MSAIVMLMVMQFLFELFGNWCNFSIDWNVLHSYLLTSWKPVFIRWPGKLMHKWQICCLWWLIVVKFKLVVPTISFKGQSCIATFYCPCDSSVRLQCTPFSWNIGFGVTLMGIWGWELMSSMIMISILFVGRWSCKIDRMMQHLTFNHLFVWEILMSHSVDDKYEPLCMLYSVFCGLVWLDKVNNALQSGFVFMHAYKKLGIWLQLRIWEANIISMWIILTE